MLTKVVLFMFAAIVIPNIVYGLMQAFSENPKGCGGCLLLLIGALAYWALR